MCVCVVSVLFVCFSIVFGVVSFRVFSFVAFIRYALIILFFGMCSLFVVMSVGILSCGLIFVYVVDLILLFVNVLFGFVNMRLLYSLS